MASWIPVQEDSDFSLQNLPYGIFSTNSEGPRIGVAIGEYVLDLKVLAKDKVFSDLEFDASTLEASRLNAYAALGRDIHRAVRARLQQLLEIDSKLGDVLRDNQERRSRSLVPMSSVEMHLPMEIGDYTDFFVGLHHAVTCTEIVKPGATVEQLCPAFYTLPVGYHGRGSSVVVSGTPFHRPRGIYNVDGTPTAGASQKLDFEAEFAAFVGRGNDFGTSIDVNQAEEHIFGFVLMNDWSARDIQSLEATIMGPLNGKNFCTTVSPWVVPPEALEPFRTAPSVPRKLLPHLTEEKAESAYNIPIRVSLQADSKSYHVTECNTNNVIFSFAQMIAHHTRGGCPLRPGDLIGTGTLSGPSQGEMGCFLELSRGGSQAHTMDTESASDDNLSRAFLHDGDTVEFRAHIKGRKGAGNVGFGVCGGMVLPAL